MAALAFDPTLSVATRPLRVLVSDDQSDVREALRLLCKPQGHEVTAVDSPIAALRALMRNPSEAPPFDLFLMDMNYLRDTTSGREGLELLAQLRVYGNRVPVVVMTAWSDVSLAVEAMQLGAVDFISKPWNNARLENVISTHARESSRNRSDIDLARRVQEKLLPDSRLETALRNTAYEGACVRARGVGGDYYDFLPLEGNRMGFVLADVSGKGIAAALLMANLQGLMRSHVDSSSGDVKPLLSKVHRLFYESTEPERYATMIFLSYDDATGDLTYVNCGHPSAMVVRAGGGTDLLGPTATVMGLRPEWTCQQGSAQLDPGDALVLYSDGVTEAENPNGEEFGELRLLSLVRSGATAREIVAAVHSFAQGERADDATVVLLRRG